MSAYFEKLEGFVATARQLDVALNEEKLLTKKLRDDLNNALVTHDRLLRDAESRNNELNATLERYKGALASHDQNERRQKEHIQALQREFEKARTELQQYRAAWSEVLQREREAKLIIRESESLRSKLDEVESRNKALTDNAANEKAQRIQLERHSKSYQLELQNTLVRLHGAEARFNEVARELQVLGQAKKATAEEVAKIEHSMRERFHWELAKEREKIRGDHEKRLFEAERGLAEERHRTQALREETRAALQQKEAMRLELDAAKGETEKLSAAIDGMNGTLTAVRAESARLAQEIDGTAALHEQIAELESKLAQERRCSREATMSAERKIDQILISEKRRTAELVARMAKPRSRKWSAKNSNATNPDAERLAAEARNFECALLAEAERSRSLESTLIAEKARFDEMALMLESEVERLQAVYPLRDLLMTRELEIKEMRTRLSRLPGNFADRAELEAALGILEGQRDRMRSVLAEHERRIDAQIQRIHRATEVNTLLAGPQEELTPEPRSSTEREPELVQ